MKNFQQQYQGQRQRQMPIHKIANFQRLLQTSAQDLHLEVKQLLKDNIFFDGVAEPHVSLNEMMKHGVDENIADFYTRYKEDAGHKMAGDGPAYMEVPDDRRKGFATPETIQDDLRRQLDSFHLTEDQIKVAGYFIDSLDKQGFLVNEKNEIEVFLQTFPHYKEGQVKSMLSFLKANLSPPGLFARDTREAIELQALRLKDSPVKATLLMLVGEHYDALITRNVEGLKKKLHMDNMELLNDVYKTLATFLPVPIPSSELNPFVRTQKEPDFIVQEASGVYQAKATQNNFPRISINQAHTNTYVASSENLKSPVFLYLNAEREKLNEVIVMLEERQLLLEKVVSYVLNHQRAYLEKHDVEQIMPLLVKEAAEKFSLDPSTVSRIAREKVIQTAEGEVINLTDLFSRGFETKRGTKESLGVVREKIRKAIDSEDKRRPKTDIELEKELKADGIVISSRRVRKICEGMNIPTSRERMAEYQRNGENQNRQIKMSM